MSLLLRCLVQALALALLTLAAKPAQARAPEFAVSVLTMGPGDPAFSKFGHNAIVVRQRGHRALVYNYGTFTFQSPNLVSDFLNRNLDYWLSVDTYEETLASYRAQNRTVAEQELALTPRQSLELARALAVNAKPENRKYRYDYFYDNCSTRVRDALDRLLGGQLKRNATGPAKQTFRQHSLRLSADDVPLYLGLDLGLSGYADRTDSEWDESFLPERFADLLRRAKVRDEQGQVVALVRSERVLFQAKRTQAPATPPTRAPSLFFAGALIGAVFFALGRRRAQAHFALAYSLLLAPLSLIVGGAGALLAFFWFFTAHEAAWANLNLLSAPPWLLLLIPAAFGYARKSAWAQRMVRVVAALTAFTTLVALLLRALGITDQSNERIALLLLPIWLGIALGELAALKRAGVKLSLRAL